MRAFAAAILVVAGCGAGTSAPPSTPSSGDDAGGIDAVSTGGSSIDAGRAQDASDAGAQDQALHVEGNHLVYKGKPTRLLGVDHSGTEYACVGSGGAGYGITEGPDPDTLATAMLAWGHVNAVRVPLNEDCWLGINGAGGSQYGGATYRAAVATYVSKLHAHGLFVIVDLHWNAPGAFLSQSQQPMADADHAPDFWKSAASAFGTDPMTVFDLYNEPHLDTSNAQTSDAWDCWLHGCTVTQSEGNVTGSWKSAGMQSLVDAVRSTGAKNVLMAGGLAWADDLSGWLAHAPSDPLSQIAASFHLYSFNACVTSQCWDSVIAGVAKQHPVITGELGEDDCAHGFVDTYMPWADAHGVSYLGWTWNTWDCKSGPALIAAYDGTATGFGQGLKAHLLATSP